jgi:uncharacterized protein (DUF1810 family)
LLLAVENSSAHDILGSPDDLKFQSCLTLFSGATSSNGEFLEALDRFYGGQADEQTLALLGHKPAGVAHPSPDQEQEYGAAI